MSASAPGSVIERTKAAMRPSSPRSSRISSTTARYSRSSSRMLPSADSRPAAPRPRRRGVLARRSSRRRRRRGAGRSSATARPPPGSRIAIGHLGDRADLRVLVLVLGHEQHTLFVADVDGEGDVHVGEDDDVFQRDEEQAYRVLAHGSRFRADVKCRSWFRNCTDHGQVLRRAVSPPLRRNRVERSRRDAAGEHVRRHADATRAPRHHARDEDAAAPEDEPRVVARRVDPAGLVQDDDARVARANAIELRRRR